MKNYFLITLLLLGFKLNAQFVDDLESCVEGFPPQGSHWGCQGGCGIICSTDQAYSGMFSGLIPDDGMADAVLDLGNKVFGEWHLSFWMYVPSNREAYWNLQGVVPIGAGEWIVGNVFFNQDNANPGVGLCDNTAIGPVNFNFPHNQWFEINMDFDITLGISLATWTWSVDGVLVLPPGTPFTDSSGTIPTSLGGVDFFSISSDNLYYLDDICFVEPDITCTLGISDFNDNSINIYPNPINDILNISSLDVINSVSISNIIGQVLYNSNVYAIETSVDLSGFAEGTYFVKASLDNNVITKKIIKE